MRFIEKPDCKQSISNGSLEALMHLQNEKNIFLLM